MPRYRSNERQEILGQTRHRLLQAATAEFASEGYVGANINRISKRAGFAKGTIYNHFDSKRALMLALIDQIAQSHLESVAEQVDEQDDAVRRLERFFEAGFAWVTDHSDQAQIMIATLNGPDDEFKLHMYQAYQPMFALVGEDIVATGIRRGVFREMDPPAMARLLMTIYLGVCSQLNEQGRPWFSPQEVVDLLLYGLCKQAPLPDGKGAKDMHAIVVYFSVYGNTRNVAETIAETLSSAGDAHAVAISELDPAQLTDAGLVVFGSPTHYQNLPKDVRALLDELPRRALHGTRVAAFDTSVEMWRPLLWMTAAHRLLPKLRQLGGTKAIGPQTFFVERAEDPQTGQRQDRLSEGELDRAREWAVSILERVTADAAPTV
jgi:AcrR family transcriptional regulator